MLGAHSEVKTAQATPRTEKALPRRNHEGHHPPCTLTCCTFAPVQEVVKPPVEKHQPAKQLNSHCCMTSKSASVLLPSVI